MTSPERSLDLRDQASTFGLSGEEYDRVVERLGRNPNPLEAALFGAMWSEHCGYKNSRPLLRRLPTEGPQVLQGPGENAGVVDVGSGWALAFKVESHNHPSAVEPFQGAATGVGGILRDIFAMGARPVAVLDSLHFGELSSERTRHLLSGVVEGIGHYGNAIGVPTVGGEIIFHPSYQDNPLVNVMAIGLLRHQDLRRGTVGAEGSLLIYVGSKTGRDGLGGAVFASGDLSDASTEDRPAVQVGDPFLEKLLLEACLEAVSAGLVVGVQDMGAAGLTSSLSEMAARAGRGIDVDLDRVPRREIGMRPVELMLSESQERMVLAVTPEHEGALLKLLEKWELDAVRIGVVRGHDRLKLFEAGEVVADVPVADLADAPSYRRKGVEDPRVAELRATPPSAPVPDDLAEVLLALLAHPTIASKAAVYERYDHQVMTNTVVLPGQGDAAVLRIRGTRRGIAATLDCNPRFVFLDPREGARHAVAEAARNLAAVGARPLAVTDNLNFGNPTRPQVYYQMEQAIEGLADACHALDTPVTGGNVSLYNQYQAGSGVVAVHPTPTVGMVGVLEDVDLRATLAFKRSGDHILLLGPNSDELGASQYLATVHGLEVGSPPELDLDLERKVQLATLDLIGNGLVDTAHDCAEGGLAVALAEMCIAGGYGADVELFENCRPDALLFGEAPSRIIVGVSPERFQEALRRLEVAEIPFGHIGTVTGEDLVLKWPKGSLRVSLTDLDESYARPIREALS